jgi:hypothetical protein
MYHRYDLQSTTVTLLVTEGLVTLRYYRLLVTEGLVTLRYYRLLVTEGLVTLRYYPVTTFRDDSLRLEKAVLHMKKASL